MTRTLQEEFGNAFRHPEPAYGQTMWTRAKRFSRVLFETLMGKENIEEIREANATMQIVEDADAIGKTLTGLKHFFDDDDKDEFFHWWCVRSATVVTMCSTTMRKGNDSKRRWPNTLETLRTLARTEDTEFMRIDVINGLNVLFQHGHSVNSRAGCYMVKEKKQYDVLTSSDEREGEGPGLTDSMVSDLLGRYGTDLLSTCSMIDRHREAVMSHYGIVTDEENKYCGKEEQEMSTDYYQGQALSRFLAELHEMISSSDAITNELPLDFVVAMMGLEKSRLGEAMRAAGHHDRYGNIGYDKEAVMWSINIPGYELESLMHHPGVISVASVVERENMIARQRWVRAGYSIYRT